MHGHTNIKFIIMFNFIDFMDTLYLLYSHASMRDLFYSFGYR